MMQKCKQYVYILLQLLLPPESPQAGQIFEGTIASLCQQKHLLGSSRLLRAYRGEGSEKFFCHIWSEEPKYISVIFVTNKDVLLCFYFYR